MFVILGSGLDGNAHIGFAGLAIGLTVGLEAAFMGPITGASIESSAIAWTSFCWEYLAAPLGLLGCTHLRSAISSHSL